MIRPEGFRGAAFGTAAEGDARADAAARQRMATQLGISGEWAYVHQVHGAAVVTAAGPGLLGDADAIVTTTRGLPVCVATADCVPVIIEGAGSTAVVHAGWRGVVAGVVAATLVAMQSMGDEPLRAAVGPAIGPCCYEVGADVASRLAPFAAETVGGTTSVDLSAAVAAQLGSLSVWRADRCTYHLDAFHSYRRDRTTLRQVAVTWLPTD